MEITEKNVINLYRHLIDPLGYVIIPKPEKTLTGWEPKDDKDRYAKMDSMSITREIAELKSRQEVLQKRIAEIKEKVIAFMNLQQPNIVTQKLYTGTYGKNTVEKNSIKVDSQEMDLNKKLVNYLETLCNQRIKEEILTKLMEVSEDIEDFDVPCFGQATAQITIR